MNRHEFFQAIICVSLLMAFLVPQKGVYAQEQNFVEIPLETFHDGEPVELLGLSSRQTLNIPIPQSWLPSDETWIEIKIRASSLLDLERSILTISLNGLQISSYALTKIAQTQQRILIPANMFSQGNNTLTFTGTLYLPDDRDTNCQNRDDPSRWLTFEPGGILHLSFVRRDLSVDLSHFPQVFIEPLEKYLPDELEKQTLIVIPENSTEDDLTSLSTISYILGSNANTNFDWHPEVITEAQFDADASYNRNIIFIGSAPTRLQENVDDTKDYIALLSSPWGQGYAVMIIGDRNRQDGFSPASVFSDPARRILLHGNVAYIDQRLPSTPPPFPRNFSFEDLGYPDRTLRGFGPQNLIYSVYIPYDVEPELVKLNLEIVHPTDLDIEKSSIIVYLNGISVAGILPTVRSSTGDPITISLPVRRLRPGINFIRISVDLHIPDSSCERAPESVWATILNSSTMDVAYRNRFPIPSLRHFPLPFSDFPGYVYVIPDQYDLNDLGYISRLSFIIGMSAPRINYPPGTITDSNFISREAENRNVILVGLPTQNSVIRDTNDLLPQPFVEGGNSLQDGFGVHLPTPDKDASLGLMQLIPSPWVKGGAILVLTGNDQQGLKWVWDVILNPALQNQFSGNLMVVGSESRSEAYGAVPSDESPSLLFQQTADASNIPIIGPILQRGGRAFLVPSLVAIGTGLLLIVCMFWIMKVMRTRNERHAIEKSDERDE